MSDYHQPVMVAEILESLLSDVDPLVVVDMTLGGGGHSQALLTKMPATAQLIGLDRDDQALQHAGSRLAHDSRFRAHKASFAEFDEALDELQVGQVDGVLMDLGVSSHQLDEAERGFSFQTEGPLDMRMDRRQARTAADLLAETGEEELANLIYRYGEERKSRQIARAIVAARKRKPFKTTKELATLITEVVGRKEKKHPATRTFQALRIAVNNELDQVEQGLNQAVRRLAPGGRIAVLSYHSLEDRLVKQAFQRQTGRCICPRELPVCACEPKKSLKILTRKPVTASDAEIKTNPRARSARLRVAQKI